MVERIQRGRGSGAQPIGRMMRQGDVLLVEAPSSAPSVYERDVRRDGAGRLVLAVGEATGHLHAIGEPTARLVDDRDARYLLVGGSGATLVHDEHAPVEIPMGRWRVVRQREWDGFVGFREVRD